MTNRYFTTPSAVVAGTTIRSDKYNSDQQGLGTAFELIQDEVDTCLRLPSTFTGNAQIPELTVTNTFLHINGDGDLTLFPMASILTAVEDAETAAQTATTAASNASSSEVNADASATSAALSETNASASATSAAQSASQAEAIVNGERFNEIELLAIMGL